MYLCSTFFVSFSELIGQSLFKIRDRLREALASRFCDDMTAKLQASLRFWTPAAYADKNGVLTARLHCGMEEVSTD